MERHGAREQAGVFDRSVPIIERSPAVQSGTLATAGGASRTWCSGALVPQPVRRGHRVRRRTERGRTRCALRAGRRTGEGRAAAQDRARVPARRTQDRRRVRALRTAGRSAVRADHPREVVYADARRRGPRHAPRGAVPAHGRGRRTVLAPARARRRLRPRVRAGQGHARRGELVAHRSGARARDRVRPRGVDAQRARVRRGRVQHRRAPALRGLESGSRDGSRTIAALPQRALQRGPADGPHGRRG